MRAIAGIAWLIVREPLVGCILVALLLAGCATAPYRERALDIDRLNNAIVLDDVGYVRGLVESGLLQVDQRIPAPAYLEGTPLITLAARAGSLGILRYLIAAGADVNAPTPAGETALMLAAYFWQEEGGRITYERHEAAVRMLVAAGANLENEPFHYTPLAYAAYQGNEHIAGFLLESGARVDSDTNIENGVAYVNTPLMMAAIQGHGGVARLLLRAGANARIRVHQGHTAAEFARKYNHPHLLPALLCAESLAPGERFSARCEGVAQGVPGVPGCVVAGATLEQTESVLREMPEFRLAGLGEDGMPVPRPSSPGGFMEGCGIATRTPSRRRQRGVCPGGDRGREHFLAIL